MTHQDLTDSIPNVEANAPLVVVAAAIVHARRLMVVSKKAAPDLFYLPGGKPDPGESPLETLRRELDEELGARLVEPRFLADVDSVAVLEGLPMRLTVFATRLDREPVPAAELADLRWTSGRDDDLRLAPAVTDHILPLLRRTGALAA
ncbi:NUDIX hydrolase [Embleya scabrispora]|uniref:NUDIX hydrolase n=1 Tax=Embleya scabrispora TaxID=159449 RepID=UPI000362811F|nr:NUDIX domain-containing protein [Embleya scabrispora]MYS85993.1 NUDIX domain-containing protein [Streptomyces sp. SID5474]